MVRTHLAVALAYAGIGVTVLGATVLQTSSDTITKTFRKETYAVDGDSWNRVRDAISQNLQIIPGTNERFEGLTTAKVSLSFGKSSEGVCDVQQAALRLDLVVRVPRASSQSTLNDQDRECWAYYDRSLAGHEEGHIYIATHDAEELLQQIRSRRNTTCGDLRRLVDQSIANTQRTQDEYDSTSSHGMRQWRAWGAAEDPESNYDKSVRDRCSGD